MGFGFLLWSRSSRSSLSMRLSVAQMRVPKNPIANSTAIRPSLIRVPLGQEVHERLAFSVRFFLFGFEGKSNHVFDAEPDALGDHVTIWRGNRDVQEGYHIVEVSPVASHRR